MCIELVRALRCSEGVAGVHLMGYRNEATLAEIVVESGAGQAVGRLQASVGTTG